MVGHQSSTSGDIANMGDFNSTPSDPRFRPEGGPVNQQIGDHSLRDRPRQFDESGDRSAPRNPTAVQMQELKMQHREDRCAQHTNEVTTDRTDDTVNCVPVDLEPLESCQNADRTLVQEPGMRTAADVSRSAGNVVEYSTDPLLSSRPGPEGMSLPHMYSESHRVVSRGTDETTRKEVFEDEETELKQVVAIEINDTNENVASEVLEDPEQAADEENLKNVAVKKK